MATDFTKKFFEDNRILKARVSYAKRPSAEELERLSQSLKETYHATEVILEEEQNEELIGGYVLQVGDRIFDNSVKASFDKLQEHFKQEKGNGNVISVLKSNLDGLNGEIAETEGGHILRLHDGIAAVDGMSQAVYGEIVLFENGTKGLVQNIDETEVLCIVLGDEQELEEGDRVIRTGKRAGIPVGKEILGRVVDALGAPIDGAGPFREEDWYLIERKAPGVLERQPVNVPMQTGILAIDAMFPIGRGQRELIIGDRQTGKTSIAIDTIINQKDKDVICVYVAIGQKASTVAQIVSNLKKHHAMDYCVVVSASASEPAALQYLAPYSGTAIAEYFMDQGKDVLIIYDDLSKHAVAYRALSLLLERSPGREAYPGDVFYLHSRLLERSSRMDEAHGGGSITALPIVETQGGDVSAYIPTNIISITDGQIFLESDLFFAGNRPAVNVGLSVSRVGGAAQTKALKKVSGTLRIDLAQYKEMESFAQFSSELDSETKEQLAYGEQLMELLKQPLYEPKSMEKQVIILGAATHRSFLGIPVKEVRAFAEEFYQWFAQNYAAVLDEIRDTGNLSDDALEIIRNGAEEYKKVKGYGKQ
ncbi:ATP synthase F1, alpha subunit [Marvinbryantia formatexigens DSM 14469]|uniref:ATP synthase subunit alpha n=1 Tax=Marvinbryantia formatexigens DSM 14469 TaxID=478749 RepID=C6LDT8_9FIRM|nr:F0F1 ATP synthase subunit alpha [Marvinbryantia formatexigens]EET61142.1 ATP synthase F1, alpha subunit [Marvinbryantia formatexigens DSM 14469]UWO23714.1 F0F1 ATP synthase subunit alpha [Marvinbryantia formatexigens DSM 14469]SDF67545.1 F-type H+-transporting ATPase subunit alpha [Marvinbryantia formatexigens]